MLVRNMLPAVASLIRANRDIVYSKVLTTLFHSGMVDLSFGLKMSSRFSPGIIYRFMNSARLFSTLCTLVAQSIGKYTFMA